MDKIIESMQGKTIKTIGYRKIDGVESVAIMFTDGMTFAVQENRTGLDIYVNGVRLLRRARADADEDQIPLNLWGGR